MNIWASNVDLRAASPYSLKPIQQRSPQNLVGSSFPILLVLPLDTPYLPTRLDYAGPYEGPVFRDPTDGVGLMLCASNSRIAIHPLDLQTFCGRHVIRVRFLSRGRGSKSPTLSSRDSERHDATTRSAPTSMTVKTCARTDCTKAQRCDPDTLDTRKLTLR
jgi:hypothetical protein